jgi:Zn-finger nucleic acid-binding protein
MCPKCRLPTIIAEWEGVEVDCCLSCDGTWLDAGELTWLADLAGVKAGKISAALDQAQHGGRTAWRCPRCNRRLEAIHLAADPPVELDRCPLGDGLWFDAGEIQAVVKAFHDGEEGEVARFLGELHHSELESHAKGG